MSDRTTALEGIGRLRPSRTTTTWSGRSDATARNALSARYSWSKREDAVDEDDYHDGHTQAETCPPPAPRRPPPTASRRRSGLAAPPAAARLARLAGGEARWDHLRPDGSQPQIHSDRSWDTPRRSSTVSAGSRAHSSSGLGGVGAAALAGTPNSSIATDPRPDGREGIGPSGLSGVARSAASGARPSKREDQPGLETRDRLPCSRERVNARCSR